MANGIRAVARLCANYPQLFGVATMREFFGRYAPAGDGANNPDAYARAVAGAVGVGIDDKVDFTDYAVVSKMLPMIFRVETGQDPYEVGGVTPTMIQEGCWRAGNLRNVPARHGYVRDEEGNIKRENIEDSETIKNTKRGLRETVAAGAAGAGGVLAALGNLPLIVQILLILIALGALGLVAWRFGWLSKRRRRDNALEVR